MRPRQQKPATQTPVRGARGRNSQNVLTRVHWKVLAELESGLQEEGACGGHVASSGHCQRRDSSRGGAPGALAARAQTHRPRGGAVEGGAGRDPGELELRGDRELSAQRGQNGERRHQSNTAWSRAPPCVLGPPAGTGEGGEGKLWKKQWRKRSQIY